MAPSTAPSTMTNVPVTTASGKFVMIGRFESVPGKAYIIRPPTQSSDPTSGFVFRKRVWKSCSGPLEQCEGLEGIKVHGTNAAILALKEANEKEGVAASMSYEFFEDP
ncbi:hypothetical protein DFH09DRAFT_1103971 [Mycena vulgaris]|nr:hypothetical protein DFH09DRAFT_1103971 [Mycena vulgaris]